MYLLMDQRTQTQQKLSLTGSVALGTGVMIGAGIFALVGQVAELAGGWVPWAFLAGAVVVAFSRVGSAKPQPFRTGRSASSRALLILDHLCARPAYGVCAEP